MKITKEAGPESMVYTSYESPLGPLVLGAYGGYLRGIWMKEQRYFGEPYLKPGEKKLPGREVDVRSHEILQAAARWLDDYFAGKDPGECPPLGPEGSPFRQSVWEILRTIPAGQTMSYGQIGAILAAKQGRSRMSAQAVGGAVGHNPILIMIPCHRVLGADGSLTGFAGNLFHKKRLLLDHEGIIYHPKKKEMLPLTPESPD